MEGFLLKFYFLMTYLVLKLKHEKWIEIEKNIAIKHFSRKLVFLLLNQMILT